jgi:hypothetical protein
MSATSVRSSAVAMRAWPLLLSGALAGVLGAAVMAIFAMVASATYHGVGFFTPMYHIASAIISPEAMMTSMEGAMTGSAFTFLPGPAAVGMLLHLATGAAFGAIFPFVGRLVGARGASWVPIGILYGALVLAFMSFAGLPIVAEVFGGGDAIRDMPSLAGPWTFTIEHLLFGLVLGLWFARSPLQRRE